MTLADLLTPPRWRVALHLDGVDPQYLPGHHHTRQAAQRHADRAAATAGGVPLDVVEVDGGGGR
jgi:hypothetical protein